MDHETLQDLSVKVGREGQRIRAEAERLIADHDDLLVEVQGRRAEQSRAVGELDALKTG